MCAYNDNKYNNNNDDDNDMGMGMDCCCVSINIFSRFLPVYYEICPEKVVKHIYAHTHTRYSFLFFILSAVGISNFLKS